MAKSDFTTQLLKGNFGNAFRSLTSGQSTADKSALVEQIDIKASEHRGGMWHFGVGEKRIFFQFNTRESAIVAFTECPELQSIITRRAWAHLNGKRWIMRSGGKGKGAEDNSEYARKCRFRLANPNPFQTGAEFEMHLKVYLDLFEWCIILPVYATSIARSRGLSEASAMFLIPPSMLTYRETGVWKNQRKASDLIQDLYLTVGGETTPLDPDEVVFIKGNNPRLTSFDSTGGMAERLLFPESRVKAQAKPINNIIGAYESRGELISYAGSQGIISPKTQGGSQYVSVPLTDPEQEDIQKKLSAQYGIRRGQYRYIVSPQPLDFMPMGRPVKDLMLFEEVQADVRALCIAWPYPHKMLLESGSSLNGTEVQQLERNWYQDSVIPEAMSIEQQLAQAFKAAENNTEWIRDYSHVSCLQEDEKKSAETMKAKADAVEQLFKGGFITYNRALEMLGEDKVTGGDVYYNEWSQANAATSSTDNPENPANDEQ